MWLYREFDGGLLLCKTEPKLNVYRYYDAYDAVLPLPMGWFPEIREGDCEFVELYPSNDTERTVYIARDSNNDCYIHFIKPSLYLYGSYQCYVSTTCMCVGKNHFPEVKALSGSFKYKIHLYRDKPEKRIMKKIFNLE